MNVWNPEGLPRMLARNIARDEVLILAGSIAYTAVLSVFPLLLAVIAVLGLFVEQPHAQQTAVNALRPYLPPDALRLVRDTVDAVARTRGTVGLLAVLGLLWGGTAVAGTLRHALNRVLKAPRSRPFLRRKLIELAMVAIGGLFISLSLLISAAVQTAAAIGAVGDLAERVLRSPAVSVLSAVGPWLFSGLAFFLIFRFLPNTQLSLRTLLTGAAAAMVLFEIAKRAFFWYLQSLASYPLVYGPLAGIVVFMVWTYLVAVLVLFSAEVMALIELPREGPVHGG